MENVVTQKDRLLQFQKSQGMSTRHFEQKIGVANGYMRQLKDSPMSRITENILEAFPELRREWLLFGEGDMVTKQSEQTDNDSEIKDTKDELIAHLKSELEYLKDQLDKKDKVIMSLLNSNV